MNTLIIAALAATLASPRLGDNLWMWGHDTGHYDGPVNYAHFDYHIPGTAPITMGDACREMGIPNCCVIRPGLPPPESDSYLDQYKQLAGISWLLWKSTKAYCLEKAVQIPNIKAFDLDDFFLEQTVEDVRSDGTKVRLQKGVMSLAEIEATRRELSEKAGHPVELRLVLYTHQLEPGIVPACEAMDKILLWTWDGKDVASMGANVCRFRSLLPDKPMLLGLYMWDFGGRQPIARAFMQSQLDLAERLYKQGIVQGLIFHCTPLVNKNLEAVEMAKAWIAAHKDDRFASEPPEELRLVNRGVADCRVELAANASEPEKFGVAEIRKYFPQATGCGELKGKYPIAISVDAMRRDLREDGFVLDISDAGVKIVGQNPRGALYGCYELLKRYVGIRWLTPGADGEYVPEMKNVIVPFGHLVVNPYLKIRKNRCNEAEGWLWNTRNGLQSEAAPRLFADAKLGSLVRSLAVQGTGPCGHIMSDLLLSGAPGKTPKERAENLFKIHPEWFPLINGERVLTWNAVTPNPCFSNDEMVEHMAEALARAISVPHAAEAYLTIGNNDTTAWCECEKCRALDVKGSRAKGARSDRYWYAVNRIARKVWEKVPQANLGGWAYQDFWYPPVKEKIDPRLRVLVSYNNQCWKHTVDDPKCPINAEWRNIFAAWKATGLPLVINRDEIAADGAVGSLMLPAEEIVWKDVLAYPSFGCNGINFCVASPFPAFQNWHAKRFPYYGKNYRWHAMWRVNYLAAQVALYGPDTPTYTTLAREAGRLYYGAGWICSQKGNSKNKSGVRKARWHLEHAFQSTRDCQGWGLCSPFGACLEKNPEDAQAIRAAYADARAAAQQAGYTRALQHIEREIEIFNLTWEASAKEYRETYREHEVYAKKGTITIDGVLDEADWAAAKPLDNFKTPPWEGRKPARVKTVAKIVRSPEMLYFAVSCDEPAMDQIETAKELVKGNPWKSLGDHIELSYQYPDMSEKCYHMMITSEGLMFCGLQVTPANFDGNYTSKAQVAVKKYADHWIAEVAIPTSEIGMKCFDGAAWRANVARQRKIVGEKKAESSSAANGVFNGTPSHVNLKFL